MSRGLWRALAGRVPATAMRRLLRLRHGENPSFGTPAGRRVGRSPRAHVVTRFDAHEMRRQAEQRVASALGDAGVEFVRLPGPRDRVEQFAVARADRDRAVAALAPDGLGVGWQVRPREPMIARADVLRVHRAISAPGGQVLAGPELGVTVAFWRRSAPGDVDPRGGAALEPDSMVAPGVNAVASHLSAEAWRRAVRSPGHWIGEQPRPAMFEVREPIDVVYTWVDGNDPAWQARRAEHEPPAGAHHASATHHSRYAAREELRYSLRSLAMFGSWVRRIHLVTDGQVPPWLDTAHPLIRVVDHREIFRDPSVLPVFNSHAIESQLHHIDGLADRYLYFNDDLFLGRPVEPELFFTGSGHARFFLSPHTLDPDPPTVHDLPATAAAKANRALIEGDFGVTVRTKYRHGVHPQLREVLAELEERHPDEFARVAASRFRRPDDLSVASSLHHSYAYLRGRAEPAPIHYRYQDIGRADTAWRLDQILRERPQVFCLNEVVTDPAGQPALDRLLQDFLTAYFPLPSPFERVAAAASH